MEKLNEQGLISGADALRALADGKDVEYSVAGENKWHDNILNISPYYFVGNGVGQFKFRLKPRTITLNVEIPAPFEPKEGETYWCFSTQTVLGYGHNVYESERADRRFVNTGAWRTEEEIKQVVAALRGGIKG